MKYSEVGFRKFYHRFFLFKMDENTKRATWDFPENDRANAVLAYGYCDREAGMTFEYVALASMDERGNKMFFEALNEHRIFARASSMKDVECFPVNDIEGNISEHYKEKLFMLEGYEASDEIEDTRGFEAIDKLRHETYIDDIMVCIVGGGNRPEYCWVRITGYVSVFLTGRLLNEPFQDFEVHEGDEIHIAIAHTINDKIIAYASGS